MILIAQALRAYDADFGSLPKSPRVGAGNELYSWRPLLYHYVDSPASESFNFSKKWDSVENSTCLMPKQFICSQQRQRQETGETSYCLWVSDQLDEHGRPYFLVFDSPCKARRWSEPDDFQIEEILEFQRKGGRFHHPGLTLSDAESSYRLPIHGPFVEGCDFDFSEFLVYLLESDTKQKLEQFKDFESSDF